MINSMKDLEKEETSGKDEFSTESSSIETEDEQPEKRTEIKTKNHRDLLERYETAAERSGSGTYHP